ncbi:SDR family NAD(P)-dependent oxidoreductase [Paractinoplanes durhamensis]|uniref:Short-chain dehydrogenase n=1 Tax=Paractinoplanes durhamensis TaxID=113563 RepID=A0ABQ3ZC70_9ACTN|nr:SDR family NAD(P)-dependent oxidoreductase [Actinoplanes durhamensis]GIE07422.1 short-chain dehydrogenase [Actinoplanes durhamensis]
MTTTLITGANKGLGFETARQLIAAGHEVWMGSRDAEKGKAAANELGGRFVQLDVTDDESVRAAAETIGHLDVLVNNAGIAGSIGPVGDVTPADLRAVYETNTFGPVRVTHTFLPLLEKSEKAVLVYVSSGLGSAGRILDPATVEFHVPTLAYGSAKAALNMITLHYAKTYPNMRVNCVDPGYTATDLNGFQGPQTIAEGAEIIVRMAQVTEDGPTGTFVDRNGTVPW